MEVMKLLFIVLLLAGGMFTFFLSILAFINVEYLKIKDGKSINSGVNLIVTSAVRFYYILAILGAFLIFLLYPQSKA